ncbi:MAG: alpha-hydroxy-acid oxidizing protein [Alphaproteobacteria bacterium]|nr:alpha-hydroxy-acid oxidizing protein [Alphaproteobacteria bacterium]
MDQIEHSLAEAEPKAASARQPAANGWDKTAWRGGAALAALGLAAGALALTRSKNFNGSGRAAPSLAPADRTLAWASPAVLGDSPKRRFYVGSNLDQVVTIDDLRAMAHRRLPGFVVEYLEGGSEDEAALSRNVAALAEWHFVHRSMVDVSRRDVSTTLFDRKMTIPVAIAPTGFNGLFWPHADLRLAEAAAEFGVPFAQSTMSNDLMSRVARVPGLRYWWQLYVFGPPEVRHTLISRARDNGCEALIITVDAQIYSNREWEHRTMSGPASLGWSARFDALMHPRWLTAGILTHGMPSFENVVEFVPKGRRGLFQSAHWIRAQMDRALTWDTVARIRESWPRKLIIKGLLTVEDCVRAAEIGADAVAISNHGGRQLDWAVAPLDLLPAVRRAVGERLTILVDGAMRRGTDVIKALALGADAVFVGRAVLYGVASAGQDGARRALDILRQELLRDLGLLGVPSVAELSPRLLVRSKQLCDAGCDLH